MNIEFGKYLDPYIIAEIGVNHGGSLKLAKQMIEEAAENGAHAAKFQTYKADKIASKHSPAYWDLNEESTTSQFELFQKFDSFEEHDYVELADFCRVKGIHFLSTPFDLDAVDMLDPLMPFFKIASADITNVPLLRKIGSKKKQVVISTGASTFDEIRHAIQVLEQSGAVEVALLHCVLNYPTPVENAQLGMISQLIKEFPTYKVGYSDHVKPDSSLSTLESAVMLGACILEKHFTYDQSLSGNDHYHAMNKDQLLSFNKRMEYLQTLIGSGKKNLDYEKEAIKHARRSIYAASDLKKGDIITEEKIIAKRPAHGISPIHWDEVLNKTLECDVEEDTPLQWSNLKKR
ncbi:MAG: N-acetylneuraminate synthase family protein [Lentisphaeraceae bacterium]|nr:N-acetylneuraminate synthase family protein [Lentisphaeraceae bacterium]